MIFISGIRTSELEHLGRQPCLGHYRTITEYNPATNWYV